ncbi:ribosome biogenesis GTP-binding protein YihA/YsxC [Rhodohalobacter mucosus]|uniref:Probable GTP-binding protein EngB n=1 Tax=Rhodohalobacter mucosus TaxID=2079485 RepID=A0A316TSY5_9BACT|nr:ribosome biogenesis GTP-binding protein YihA/YsxC [Rhodohalobacter mucosus]PWN05362.1 YihA family ribosome biogenesis GTP-binding protein [Rhodohalobacter mucosus]
MAFNKARFITSAPKLSDCPPESLPEICFAGRSNVGKSSIINKITNRKRLARTSNTPGKTQQMNYYEIDDSFYLVDLPGFGYAKVPKKERDRWGRDIQNYLLKRNTLHLVLHLVDSRHPPSKLDEEFFYWLGSNQKPFAILLTKADKISNNKLRSSLAAIRKILEEMNIDVPVIPCSAQSGKGIEEIRSLILEFTDQEHLH